MSDEKDTVLRLELDAEQMRALLDLQNTTHQSITSLIREGLEMYLQFKRKEAAEKEEPPVFFPPFIIDVPYRDHRNQ